MTIKTVTSWGALMIKAKALGNARKSGDINAIKQAEEDLKAYEKLCLESDRITLGINIRGL